MICCMFFVFLRCLRFPLLLCMADCYALYKCITDKLPAIEKLEGRKNIFVIDTSYTWQDKSLTVVILNLMPLITTETDIVLRCTEYTSSGGISFMKIKSHTSKNTPTRTLFTLKTFYTDFDLNLRHERKYDGMIGELSPGAPVGTDGLQARLT